MKKINQTEEVREKLGISQQDLADFLGIPRSQVSMYELKERQLPGAGMEKLSKLELMHHDMETGKLNSIGHPEPHHSLGAHTSIMKNQIQSLVDTSEYKKMLLERRLKTMRRVYEKIAGGSRLMKYLLAATAEAGREEGDLLWLQKQQRQLAKKEIRYGKALQALTEAKIAICDHEIEAYKKVLDSMD